MASPGEFDVSAVLSLAGQPAEDESAAHELIARGDAVLVSWATGSPPAGSAWGPALAGSSGLARALTQVVQQAGTPAVAQSAAYFRVVVPAGQTIRDLVPAVGGGFRGLVRGSTGIVGHARLVPVAGAAAGTGAAIALGPLLGLMAVGVGAEMLARHQQEQQLKAISQGVEALLRRERHKDLAVLQTAEDAIRRAGSALLDRIEVPDSVGLAPAAHDLSSLKNRAAQWLGAWEAGVRQHPVDEAGLDVKVLRELIGGPIDSADAFVPSVHLIRRAVALDSRMRLLSAVEAATLNPHVDLRNFRSTVEQDLNANAALLERLTETVMSVADYRVTTSMTSTYPRIWAAQQLAAGLSRTAHAVSRSATALPLIDDQNRLVIEAQRRQDGMWSVREPLALTAA